MVARIRHSWCMAGLLCVVGVSVLAVEGSAGSGNPHAQGKDVVVITLRAEVEVSSPPIAVRDVASVDGGELPLRQQIASLDLADAPGAGQTLPISAKQIAYRLQLAGIDARSFRLEGALSTQVCRSRSAGNISLASYQQPSSSPRGHRYEVPEDDLLRAAWQHLLHRLPWQPGDVTIKLAQPIPGPIVVPAVKEDVRLEAEVQSVGALVGKTRVDVGVYTRTKKQTNVPIYLQVELQQTVALVTRRIDIGQALTEENTRLDRRPVDGVTSYVTSAEGLAGKRARRLLIPGHLVAAADVEAIVTPRPILVKQRELVRLVVRIGSLQVTAMGEALQDGGAGDPIRVRNIDSKNVVLGRVVERSVVEVGN